MSRHVVLVGRHGLYLTGDFLQGLGHLHLLLEVLQHVLAAAPQVGLQQDGVPLLVVHGLGDLAAQEPEEEVADAFALVEGGKGGTNQMERSS